MKDLRLFTKILFISTCIRLIKRFKLLKDLHSIEGCLSVHTIVKYVYNEEITASVCVCGGCITYH